MAPSLQSPMIGRRGLSTQTFNKHAWLHVRHGRPGPMGLDPLASPWLVLVRRSRLLAPAALLLVGQKRLLEVLKEPCLGRLKLLRRNSQGWQRTTQGGCRTEEDNGPGDLWTSECLFVSPKGNSVIKKILKHPERHRNKLTHLARVPREHPTSLHRLNPRQLSPVKWRWKSTSISCLYAKATARSKQAI
jgi:hypothetical protein